MKYVPSSRNAEVRRWLEEFLPLTAGMLSHKNLKLMVSGPPGQIRGVIGIRDHSVLYPVLPHALEPQEVTEASRLLSKLRESICVMGPKEWVERADQLLVAFRPHRGVEYDFVTRPRGQLPPSGMANVTLARSKDAAVLFPLQEGYEKEEVLFSPDEFQPLVSWLAFQKTLREQVVLVLWETNQPVAQARTNARYRDWAQVGGVYTLPSHRRRGFQRILLSRLIEFLDAQGQGACLFVKKDNAAAYQLYLGLGFRDPVDFWIGYWIKGPTGALPPNKV